MPAENDSKMPYPPTLDVDSDGRAASKKASGEQTGDSKESDVKDLSDSDKKESTDAKPTKPFYRRPVVMTILIIAFIALTTALVLYWLHARQFEWTDDAFIDGRAVRLAPKVAGYVSQLNVADNQFVNRGDCLLVIDQRDYDVALAAANDALKAAEGQLSQAKARVEANIAQMVEAEADIKSAEATAENAKQDLARNEKLAPRAASQEALDASIAKTRMTQAQLESSQARLVAAQQQVNLAKSQVTTAQAQVSQARDQVRQAELNHSYTRIIAPISGHVTRRAVEEGDYLQPGSSLMAIVSPDVWVTANFKETQLELMQPGQTANIRIDSYPNHPLRGHVDSIQRGSGARFSVLPAENATGNYVKVVQRIPVKIVLDEPVPEGLTVGLGMSVIPTVAVRAPVPRLPGSPPRSGDPSQDQKRTAGSP